MQPLKIHADGEAPQRSAMPAPHERPTMGELAAASAGRDPWSCPRCGCKHIIEASYQEWYVRNTYPLSSGNPRRIRICRYCGQFAMRTEEVPVPEGFKVTVVPNGEKS